MKSSVIAAEHDEDQPEQRAGELAAPRAGACCSSSSVKTGTKAALERRVGDQRAEQVRHLEGDRERRGRARACRSSCAATISRDQPGDPREAGGDREDRGVARDPAARRGRRARSARSLGAAASWSVSLDARGPLLVGAGPSRPRRLSRPPRLARRRHGQHPLPEEAHPARRARALENRRYTSTIKTYFRRLEAAVAAGDDDDAPTPSTAASSRRSTRPSSAARCTATPAPARSPAPPALRRCA